MTIQEVLNSGKKFKRPHWDEWLFYDNIKHNGWFTSINENGEVEDIGTSVDLYKEDICANDWVVE